MERFGLRACGRGANILLLACGAALLALVAAGCATESPERTMERVEALGPGVLARVDGQPVHASFVRDVAERHDLDLDVARDRVVTNALFALEARKRFADTGFVEVIERSVFADALLEEFRARAEARGAPTPAELGKLREEHWVRFDRPVSVTTVHAVVQVKEPADDASAARVAKKIYEATAGALKPEDFAKVARGVGAEGLDKRVEALPPVTPDGRTVEFDPAVPVRIARLDPAFAAAAHAIANEGERSPVIKTPFGYHVILLVERIDAQHYGDQELGKRFGSLVLQERAKQELEPLLEGLQRRTTVHRARNLERLTGRYWGQR